MEFKKDIFVTEISISINENFWSKLMEVKSYLYADKIIGDKE